MSCNFFKNISFIKAAQFYSSRSKSNKRCVLAIYQENCKTLMKNIKLEQIMRHSIEKKKTQYYKGVSSPKLF